MKCVPLLYGKAALAAFPLAQRCEQHPSMGEHSLFSAATNSKLGRISVENLVLSIVLIRIFT